ncbi:hypothetical protein BSKO_10960 [Bryopsis sp. KO-2023]|nr:hypothetical protein BSKO_10960 [Bryopsis sp. KO-2023]
MAALPHRVSPIKRIKKSTVGGGNGAPNPSGNDGVQPRPVLNTIHALFEEFGGRRRADGELDTGSDLLKPRTAMSELGFTSRHSLSTAGSNIDRLEITESIVQGRESTPSLQTGQGGWREMSTTSNHSNSEKEGIPQHPSTTSSLGSCGVSPQPTVIRERIVTPASQVDGSQQGLSLCTPNTGDKENGGLQNPRFRPPTPWATLGRPEVEWGVVDCGVGGSDDDFGGASPSKLVRSLG